MLLGDAVLMKGLQLFLFLAFVLSGNLELFPKIFDVFVRIIKNTIEIKNLYLYQMEKIIRKNKFI